MGLFGGKQQETTRKFDMGTKIKNMLTLIETGRRKEAIAYMFMLYSMVCGAKYKAQKHPSQSIRDYAMVMVQNFNQSPKNVYPFVTSIEAVIYGGKQPSQEVFNSVKGQFSTIIEEIVGKKLPAF